MTEFNNATFNRIKSVAKQRGYSLLTLNDKADLGKNVIYGWKTKKPSYENIQAVANVLGVSVDYLLGDTEDMHSNKTNNKIDLYTVDDNERNELISANGQPISDDDWMVIKALLSKYPKQED